MMRIRFMSIILSALAIGSALGGCGSKSKSTEAIAGSYTAEAVTEEAESQKTENEDESSQFDLEDEYTQIPDELESDFNRVIAAANELFENVSGDKMYGFKGECEITIDGEDVLCQLFDFYTYNDSYTKIAVFASDSETGELYYSQGGGDYLPVDEGLSDEKQVDKAS
ncbi:MAG: hypothetical protein LUE12_05055 [Ruminococcus sp.]|nr:hypothetical protein [Ruminococcus sp.]